MSGHTLVIGAGTNLGGRRSILRAARDLVAHRFGVADLRVAPVWETAPMGPPQPDYLNTAFAFDYRGALPDALDRCLDIERALGRERRERWGARTLDLDLLWHASMSCDGGGLTVPHQGLRERTFALDPLLSLVPDAVDPRDGTALSEVRRTLPAAGPSTLLGEGFEALPGDRADALAALAEEIAARRDCSSKAAPVTTVGLELPWADGVSDDGRIREWIASVTGLLDSRRFVLRRAAVIEDSERLTRALLFGEEHALRSLFGLALDS